jgi:long-chain fatty acid transport protein
MSMSMKRLGVAALLLLARQASATNGYFLEGYGTDSKAQAGAGIALPLDSLTVATNPAGLTAVADAVTVGVEIFRPRRSATLVQDGQAEEFDGDDAKIL